MEEKRAFVFDTNFIVQYKNLDDVVEKLKDDFTVYVSQVSIDERIAQECRDVKENYETIESWKEKYSRIATIKIRRPYEDTERIYHEGMQRGYDTLFGDRIIPFSKDETTFSAVIDRANRKFPPFLSDPKASDRGFKDCLLWLSLLSFFKDNGPIISFIPYFTIMSFAICVATSMSLLAPVDISSNATFSAALPPSNAISFSSISVFDI